MNLPKILVNSYNLQLDYWVGQKVMSHLVWKKSLLNGACKAVYLVNYVVAFLEHFTNFFSLHIFVDYPFFYLQIKICFFPNG